MVNAKLKFFETPGIRRIFEDDDMELESLGTGKNRDGKTKTALFLIIPAVFSFFEDGFLCLCDGNALYADL